MRAAVFLGVLLIVLVSAEDLPIKTFPPSTEDTVRVDALGLVLRRHVWKLRNLDKAELVFLVDSSVSVGADNFASEVGFVRRLLADFTVSVNATRVALITYSSKDKVLRELDYISEPLEANHKCALLNRLNRVQYSGGATYTLGAVRDAQEILKHARPEAAKVVFLVTDGYSNGGDPRPAAQALKEDGATVYTFGIRNGNVRELKDMASSPCHEHSYILNSFQEFEALARRALHEDMHDGVYQRLPSEECDHLCSEGTDCCDASGGCSCGLHSGQYTCLCPPGHYGTGLRDACRPCPRGTFQPDTAFGDVGLCVPCPDPRHTSSTASTSEKQCVCKLGYAQDGESCKVVHCPKPSPPDNGYLVNPDCSTVFNAACGFRCNAGFGLVGNSIRVCQQDGTWSGNDPFCRRKKCEVLKAPYHGSMRCTTDRYDFETECRFGCEEGYVLIGSRRRTCLSIALWDGLPAFCRAVTCPPLEVPQNGHLESEHCAETRLSFGESCQYRCEEGFALMGQATRECTSFGVWSGDEPSCVDTTPPTIACPTNIVVGSEPGYAEALVDWEVPEAIDNGGVPLPVTATPAVVPPQLFSIGTVHVTYVARDDFGNEASCGFSVAVEDREPPTVEWCQSPPAFVADENFVAAVSWEEPVFSDNSGEDPRVWRSRAPGPFPLGRSEVVYVAKDAAGNNASCVIEIVVKEHACVVPAGPTNGEADCWDTRRGVACRISCRPGYGLQPGTPTEFFCAYDGTWSPHGVFPDCSEAAPLRSALLTGNLLYSSPGFGCGERFVPREVESSVRQKLTLQGPRGPRPGFSQASKCPPGVKCSVRRVKPSCLKKGKNQADVRPGRIARSVEDDADAGFLEVVFEITSTSISTPADRDDLKSSLVKLEADLSEAASGGALDVSVGDSNFTVVYLDVEDAGGKFVCEEGSVYLEEQCVKCPRGTFHNYTSESCQLCPRGTYQSETGRTGCPPCPNGTGTAGERAKSVDECKRLCTPGSYSPTGVAPCRTCLRGRYQSDYGATSCDACPDGTSTKRRGTVDASGCRVLCAAGYVSKTGLEPCLPCPRGFYQPEAGRAVCYRCDSTVGNLNDTATCHASDGSTVMPSDQLDTDHLLVNDCFSTPCQNDGECEPLSFGFLCRCRAGFSGTFCEFVVDACLSNPCAHGGTCESADGNYACICPDGFGGENCRKDVDECLLSPCGDRGLCANTHGSFTCSCTAGFKGPRCEVDVDECLSFPCTNGGSCVNFPGNYSCDCLPVYSGRYCEVLDGRCDRSPCLNGAKCIDEVSGFRCLCEPGYQGELCEEDVDDCSSAPCEMGGTCVDRTGGFECLCPPGYSGWICESELDTSFQLSFSGNSTLDAAIKRSLPRPLTEVTVCLWMKTADELNYGTPFSYATDAADNTLTLTDYGGLVIYVNNTKVVTDVVVNDGRWHVVCFAWSSAGGRWSLYKDGELAESGVRLAVGFEIPESGVLVLGQEQDSRGADFSPSESFSGALALVNIWNRTLAPEEMSSLVTECDTYFGDVIAWPDFLRNIRGKVVRGDSGFCRGCPDPTAPPNGAVSFSSTVVGATVTYACDVGYVLRGRALQKCLASGEWSHPTPKCTGIPCEVPSTPKNGRVVGSSLHFGDRIAYSCWEGYRLVGAEERVCREDGKWTDDDPTCEEITCNTLPTVQNGLIETSQVRHEPGSVLKVSCDVGHRLEREVVCTADGTWSDSEVVCQTTNCSRPPTVPHGMPVFDGTSRTPSYVCDRGFVLEFNGSLSCTEDGIWEGRVPACRPISCGHPPQLEHGLCTPSDTRMYGDVVSCHCNLGYALSGNGTSACTETGNWTPVSSACNPVHCPIPADPFHGNVTVSDTGYGGIASYDCDPGFELLGARVQKCRYDGQWSEMAPSCVPQRCQQHDAVLNGRVLGTERTVGSAVMIVCNPGYELAGPLRRVCALGGRWTSVNPSCLPVECPVPESVPHSTMSVSGRRLGGRVRYTCDEGYILSGSPSRICNVSKNWNPAAPDCLPVRCGIPPSVENARVEYNDSTFGAVAKYVCNTGFVGNGTGHTSCSSAGSWSETDLECKIVRCRAPPAANGTFLYHTGTKYGSTAEYYCSDGFVLEGPRRRTCLSDGSWSDDVPTCVPIPCDLLPAVEHGSVSYAASMATVACDPGYRLVGTRVLRCFPDGTWSSPPTTCVVQRCPSNETEFDENLVDQADTSFVEVVHTQKLDRLESRGQRTCPNGTLAEQTECAIVRCTVPAAPLHGSITGSNYTFLATVEYECDAGHRLEGLQRRTCLENGSWSGSTPRCEAIVCELSSLPDSTIPLPEKAGFAPGEKAILVCGEGRKFPDGRKAIDVECDADGTWSPKPLPCRPVECPLPTPVGVGSVTLITGSQLSSRSFEAVYGDEAVLGCPPGYRATEGHHRATCREDGRWSADLECVAVR